MKLGETETSICSWLYDHMISEKIDLCLADAAVYGQLTMKQMALITMQAQEQCRWTAVALRDMGLAGRSAGDAARYWREGK